MIRLPQKPSLASQTAAILKEEIQSGHWHKWLPSEQELCGQLHVSRVTLRTALKHLQSQRLIRSSQGRRREIIASRRPPSAPVSDRVLLLTPMPIQFLQPAATFWVNKLREDLADAGYHLEIHVSRALYGHGWAHALKVLIEHLRPAGCVLMLSSQKMQRWFSERGLPCVISGSRHPGVELPSVDTAYRAACRHAVGQFLTRGHRRLVLLNPGDEAAGDLESEEGFNEAIARSNRSDVEASVVRHDGTVAGVCSKVDGLLRKRNRPTAFLVSRPGPVLTVMGQLLRCGLRLPKDVSLISRDHDWFLEHAIPSVARYVVNPVAMAQRISRVVLEMVQGGRVSTASCQIMPEFVPGETLGPAPER